MSAIYGIAGGSSRERRRRHETCARWLPRSRRRGPDDETRWIETRPTRWRSGFRFLRTAIGEDSPGVVVNEDRSLMMVCDGHVFNAATAAVVPARQGPHDRRTQHSCELLLHLYEEEGISGWRRADGQFALALWDARAQRLVLGRDCPWRAAALLLEQHRRRRLRLRDQGAAREPAACRARSMKRRWRTF